MVRISILSLVLLFSSACSSVLFYPTKVLYYDPAVLKLSFEEVKVPSYDGTQLYGWYFHHKKGTGLAGDRAKGLIFYAHGNAENISSHFTILSWVLDSGYDFYIFDYRGFGVSAGTKPGPREAVGDTIAALRWADAKAKEKKIPLAVFGQSIGGALLMRALVEEKERIQPSFIAVESTFLSFQWAGASVFSQSFITTLFQPLAFLLLSDEWAPRARIQELRPTPFLVMHGDHDRIIDFRLGEEVFDAALPPKEFIRVSGGGHIQAFWGPDQVKYRALFLEKMDRALRSH